MKTFALIFPSFILGGVLGWAAGWYFEAKSTQQAVLLLHEIHLDQVETRATEAYESQSADVAAWELNYAIDRLKEARQLGYEGPRSAKLKLFLVHARLARIQHESQKEEEAQTHFREACRYYNGLHPDAKIEDFQTLLERLQKFDDIAKVERKL
jgi:hypothetical protein